MICLSSLADDTSPLVLDTSVLINLHACSFGEQVLSALPNDVAVPDIVVRELQHETSRTNGEHQFLGALIAENKVDVITLDDAGWSLYETLITTAPSLGDGEAATIAVAVANARKPVIDDSKGRKRFEAFDGDKGVAWSLDVLTHPVVQHELGGDAAVEAVYLALREGRMRVDEGRCEEVVSLIGVERALKCTSLPGYKSRRDLWQKSK
jgi:predicted nucleic acid-binding protein